MTIWRSQHFLKIGKELGHSKPLLDSCAKIGRKIQSKASGAEPIFTLRHLAHLSGVEYRVIREVVERSGPERYRTFRIMKKAKLSSDGARYRIICVPDGRLMALQRWINKNILSSGKVHEASVAFNPGNNIVEAARLHCGCSWLIKLDIANFFESITEQSVFHVFADMGYEPLVAFELARVCTRRGQPSHTRSLAVKRWRPRSGKYPIIPSYGNQLLGHLPQGAPTSPVLANLVMHTFDCHMASCAQAHGLLYTRYADDLTFSRHEAGFSRKLAEDAVAAFYQIITRHGFMPKYAKTSIVPPGARRIVLGLLVDGKEPRLSKEFRNTLRLHLHHIGPDGSGAIKHAEENGFRSIYGLRNHIGGLISFAHQVEPALAKHAWKKFDSALWP
jgi:RNA-directed DNA polymerase